MRTFVDKEIIPHARTRARRQYPEEIVEGMKEMGLFGLTIPEEYGGLGESLLTYALVVEEIARGWMSVSGVINTHFIVALHDHQHGTEEQKQRFLPRMATGEVRGRVLDVRAGPAVPTSPRSRPGPCATATTTSSTAQKMWLTNGGSVEPGRGAGAHRRGRGRRRTRT